MENYLNTTLNGRYEMQEIIGIGGMAVVYKAYDKQDDRVVAVKILKEEYLANDDFRTRFKNESKAIAVLSHPNIVKVYDVNFGEKMQYIVMEHVEGITLKEYIERQNAVDWKQALQIVIQILRALQHAHDKGIIHRDIKPQNTLLLQNGTLKVTDFGIARFNRGAMRTNTEHAAIGSPHYVCPEQARGEYTDEKSDIYSVGIVLYEMLTGKLPFESDDANDVAVMQLQKDPVRPTELNPSIPVGLEQITLRAMQKNPKDRYQSAAEMLLDLDVFKRNPMVKFDYTFFVDNTPTRYLNVAAAPLPVSKPIEVEKEAARRPVPAYVPEEKKTEPVVKKEEPQQMKTKDDIDALLYEEDDYEFRGRNLTVPLLTLVSVVLVAVVGFVMLMIFYDPLANYFTDNEDSKIGKVFSYLSEYFGEKEMEVPNFINMTFDEVKDKYPHIKFEDPSYELNSEFEAGRVCSQTPEPSAIMTKDTVIKLVIARSATSQIAIPDVIGKNYVTAQSELRAYGFTVVVMPVFAENETIGNVIRTDPVAGTMLETLKKVTIYYASSIDTSVVSVPNVVGMLKAKAEDKIRAQGLMVGDVSYEPSSASLKGYVIAQTPVADSGYKVAAGSAVNLVIGSGVSDKSSVNFSITLPSTNEKGSVYLYLNNELVETYANQEFNGKSLMMTLSGAGSANTFEIFAGNKKIYSGSVDFTKSPVKITDVVNHQAPQQATLPNVVGMTKEAAMTALNNAGFKNVSVKTVASNEKAGKVVSQNPVASDYTKFALDTAVTIYVSSGPAAEEPTTAHIGEEITLPPQPTEPPATDPPITPPDTPTQAPVTNPPVTEPPVTNPPATEAPTVEFY